MLSSNNLYHFTPKLCYLESILREGIRVSYCLEDYSWLIRDDYEAFEPSSDEEEVPTKIRFGVPMACFCDIPPKLVQTHMDIYGQYGIGFKKEWGKRLGINPLLYLVDKSNPATYLGSLETLSSQLSSDQPTYGIRNSVISLLSYTKPYEGYFKKREYENENHRFYDEREWRYIPASNKFTVIEESTYEQLGNKCIDHISFKPEEVEVIIVNTSLEKENLQNTFTEYQNKVITVKDFELKGE